MSHGKCKHISILMPFNHYKQCEEEIYLCKLKVPFAKEGQDHLLGLQQFLNLPFSKLSHLSRVFKESRF